MLIDSHVNLHAPQYDEDREAVIERARAAGVARMVTICDKVSSFPAVLAVAETHGDIWCSVGTHPHEAKENPSLAPKDLIRLADHARVVGGGVVRGEQDVSPATWPAQSWSAPPHSRH